MRIFSMKKEMVLSHLIVCSSMLFSTSLYAQEDVHIGVLGGMHISNGSFSDLNNNYFGDPKSVSGTAFGAFVELDLNEHFSLRPELMFLKRGTELEDIQNIVKLRHWTSDGYSYTVNENPGRLNYKLDAKYADIRVPVIYNFCKPGDIRPYIYVAPVFGLVTGGDISLTDIAGTYSVDVSKANMASTYFAGQLGVGVKFPLGPVDFGIEANYELGFTDTYGSKEKDGEARAYALFPVYDIKGTRKFTGFEFAAHISVPLSGKSRSSSRRGSTLSTNRVSTGSTLGNSRVSTQPRKNFYTIDEVNEMVKRGNSVTGYTIGAIDVINFEYNKSTLTLGARNYLNKIAEFMKTTGASIEIKGHTDGQGTEEYNMELSRKRAKAVYDYLVAKGIPSSRLSYSYYGESQPIDTNDTETGRKNNRRVEFEIK